MYHEKQLSYCYFAKVVGEKGEPQFTDEEKESGFSVMWLPAQDALQTIKDSHANENEGKLYITTRDGIFLEAATGFLKLYV